mmetsp:Transcript_42758/g.132045  ORF Transcript_42758/g.132045 Transcript_42758/m.132045 type:complete len:312 (+) Transcript_42758:1177-2112(+)
MGVRKFRPDQAPSEEERKAVEAEAEELRKETIVQGNQHWRDFLEFERVYKLEGKPCMHKLMLFAAAQRQAGLKASSIATSVRKMFAHSGWPAERKVHVERVAKAIERRYKDAVNQAPYYRGSDLVAILESIDPVEVEACMAFELMLFTPLRFADIEKVETRFMRMMKKTLHVQVWQTKTIRSALDRVRIKINLKGFSSRVKKEMARRVTTERIGKKSETPQSKQPLIRDLTLERFNETLKKACAVVFPGRKPPTSYSIRYFFIRSMVEKHTTGKGRNEKIDWAALQQDTLHRTLKSMKSAYLLALPPTNDE